MSLPSVACITCTYNRHYHLERVVKMFIDQDFRGDHLLLIYNNNPISQELASLTLPRNKRIVVVNNCLDYKTGQRYTNLGAIYRDALTHISPNTEVITHMDDDDSYLKYHISEGVKGFISARIVGKKAYKPKYSYYRDSNWKTTLASNTLEPSIFISAGHLFEHGYTETTSDQHYGWYQPLIEQNALLIEEKGTPTLIYQWMGDVWKTSGDPQNYQNWDNCRNYRGDVGDRVITPVSDKEIAPYYNIG